MIVLSYSNAFDSSLSYIKTGEHYLQLNDIIVKPAYLAIPMYILDWISTAKWFWNFGIYKKTHDKMTLNFLYRYFIRHVWNMRFMYVKQSQLYLGKLMSRQVNFCFEKFQRHFINNARHIAGNHHMPQIEMSTCISGDCCSNQLYRENVYTPHIWAWQLKGMARLHNGLTVVNDLRGLG